MKSIIQSYKKYLNNENIRHLLLNYSMSSHGAKHPNGPVGWIIRDEGQVDIYAGKARQIMGIKGEYVTMSTFAHHLSERTTFTVKGISNFRILGKHFVREIFDGQQVLAIKPGVSLGSYSVIGPETFVQNEDGTIGRIILSVPILELFDERMIFDVDTEDNNLMPSMVEITKLVTDLRKGK